MVSDGAADDCHVPQLGVGIADGKDDRREEHAARAAVRNARLRKVVCEHIVPHLALIHREWSKSAAAEPPTADDINAFGMAILGSDPEAADRLFERLRERGLTIDELFENLLAPTARRLGELWEQDICDFVEVTIGVNRLRIMLETYSSAPTQASDPRRRALLIAPPQESHRFGLDVVATFLRASGWDAIVDIGLTPQENAKTAAGSWFSVAGVTVSKDANLMMAARAIEAIRRASLNPSIAVIVGGWGLRGRPDLVARIGADATAEDGPSAALVAERLFIAQAASLHRRA